MFYFYSTEQQPHNSSFYRGVLFEDLLRRFLSVQDTRSSFPARSTHPSNTTFRGFTPLITVVSLARPKHTATRLLAKPSQPSSERRYPSFAPEHRTPRCSFPRVHSLPKRTTISIIFDRRLPTRFEPSAGSNLKTKFAVFSDFRHQKLQLLSPRPSFQRNQVSTYFTRTEAHSSSLWAVERRAILTIACARFTIRRDGNQCRVARTCQGISAGLSRVGAGFIRCVAVSRDRHHSHPLYPSRANNRTRLA